MTPEEIRNVVVEPNRLQGIVFFLRELTAQAAEANEIARVASISHGSRSRGVKLGGAHAVRSTVRNKSGTKRFYVDRWKSAVEANMLPEFVPKEGFKEIEDLELNESTEGRLGNDDNGKLKRVQ